MRFAKRRQSTPAVARQLPPSDSLLDADRRALTAFAEAEERVKQENVEVDFDSGHRQRAGAAPTTGSTPSQVGRRWAKRHTNA
jgi:hypothetical protein